MIKLMTDENLQKAINAVCAPNMWPSYKDRDESGQGTGKDGKPIFDKEGYCWHDYHVELLARRPKQPEYVFPDDLDRKNQAFEEWYDE
jgi:hypothetical protein